MSKRADSLTVMSSLNLLHEILTSLNIWKGPRLARSRLNPSCSPAVYKKTTKHITDETPGDVNCRRRDVCSLSPRIRNFSVRHIRQQRSREFCFGKNTNSAFSFERDRQHTKDVTAEKHRDASIDLFWATNHNDVGILILKIRSTYVHATIGCRKIMPLKLGFNM